MPYLTSVELPDTVETIGDEAFMATNIENMVLPESFVLTSATSVLPVHKAEGCTNC